MLKTMIAIAAAAACAGVLTGFAPATLPADAAAVRATGSGDASCSQPWPYYERSCMRGSQKSNRNARLVRVIAVDKQGAVPAPRMRHRT
jgi:hypothetical protein